MTCKDCIHYEVCLEEAKSKNESLNDFDIEGIEDFCRFSKPKSRYIELPCAVGDTVWFEMFGQIEFATIYCCRGDIMHNGFVITDANAKTIYGTEVAFDGKCIGKTVFLTREEAEKALERSEGK